MATLKHHRQGARYTVKTLAESAGITTSASYKPSETYTKQPRPEDITSFSISLHNDDGTETSNWYTLTMTTEEVKTLIEHMRRSGLVQ